MGLLVLSSSILAEVPGTLKWTYPTDEIKSAPAIGIDGTVYVQSVGAELYAINADGTLKFQIDTGGTTGGDYSPVVAQMAQYYFASASTD